MTPSTTSRGAMLALALLATACTGSFSIGGANPSQAAVDLIEGELAEQLGLQDVTATCPSNLGDLEEGDTFTCTSTSGDGSTNEFLATIEPDDRIFVTTTGEVDGDTFSRLAVDLIEGQSADLLGIGTLEANCPADPGELEVGDAFQCTATTLDSSVVEAGSIVESLATVEPDNMIFVEPINAVNSEVIEEDLLQQLVSQETGAILTRDGVDCGQDVALLQEEQLTCEISPSNAPADTATLTFVSIDPLNYSFAFGA